MARYAAQLKNWGVQVTKESLLKAAKEQPLYTHGEINIDEKLVARAKEIDKAKREENGT